MAWNLWVLVSSLSLPVLVRSLSSFLGHRYNSAIVQGSSYESKPSLVSTLLWHAPLRADPRKTNDPTSSRNLTCHANFEGIIDLKISNCAAVLPLRLGTHILGDLRAFQLYNTGNLGWKGARGTGLRPKGTQYCSNKGMAVAMQITVQTNRLVDVSG